MLIREKQLNLFEDPAPDMLGGVADLQYGTPETQTG